MTDQPMHFNTAEPLGFHGDAHLLQLVQIVMHNADAYIETGINVGQTFGYVASQYPHITCYGCEVRRDAYEAASERMRAYENIRISHETSPRFLQHLFHQLPDTKNSCPLFWIDAHGHGFQWPLRDEIKSITQAFTRAFILIDDFKVPGNECFEYDQYMEQECSLEYIKDAIMVDDYRIFYPAYSEKTPTHYHPLRGWGLIVIGDWDERPVLDAMSGLVVRGESKT